MIYLAGGVLVAILVVSLTWRATRARRDTTTPVSEHWLAEQRRLKEDL